MTEDEVRDVARIYHSWRGEKEAGQYEDKPGLCRSAGKKDIVDHGYVLTPGSYVGATEVEDNDEPFAQTMKRLAVTLEEQFAESSSLELSIRKNLRWFGYGD